MRHQWAAKVLLMVAWPILAFMLLLMTACVLVAAWFVIPFGAIDPKEGGGYSMKWPWS
jgi:hypothetical protein